MYLKLKTFLSFILLSTTLSCTLTNPGGDADPTTQASIRETPAPTVSLIETLEHQASTATFIPEPPSTTRRPNPTQAPASPTPEPAAPMLIDQGFGQNEERVGYAIIVHNPSQTHLYESIRFDINLYDDSGTLLATDGSYITQLLPGQKMGVADRVDLEAGQTAVSMSVDIEPIISRPASITESQTPAGLTVRSITYYQSATTDRVTGLISSPFSRTFSTIRLSAVLYDESDNIIGGGLRFLDFILPDSTIGVNVPVSGNGSVVRAELYPMLTSTSLRGPRDDTPSEPTDLRLINYGFAQDNRNAAFGLIVEAGETTFALKNSQYHVTFFAQDGAVLRTDSGYINVVLPGQRLGLSATSIFDEGQTAERMEVQILPGERVEISQVQPPFTLSDPTFQEDSFRDKVIVNLMNPHYQTITNLRLSAFVLDETGQIIGAGFTFADYSVNGQQTAEISILINETLINETLINEALANATFLVYATPSSISEVIPFPNE